MIAILAVFTFVMVILLVAIVTHRPIVVDDPVPTGVLDKMDDVRLTTIGISSSCGSDETFTFSVQPDGRITEIRCAPKESGDP